MAERIVNQLRQIELFSALDQDDLEAVAELVHEERYPRGELVFKQGEIGRACYAVQSGELRVLRINPDGVEQEVRRLTAGDFIGESSLLLGEPHDATVEVVQDAVLFTIHRADFNRLVAERPSILDDLKMSSEVERRRRAPRYNWQEPDEVVVFVLRKHVVVLLRHLLLPGLSLFVILAAYFFLIGSTGTIGLVLGGVVAAVPLLFGLYHVIDHLNDKYILTNRRVIHDEHVYLIYRSRVGAPLNNIQSIQQVQEGMLARSFGFGDLLIETAGEPGGVVTFRQIPDPTVVQKRIFRQRERVEAQARAEERAAIQDALHRRLGEDSRGREPASDQEASSEQDGRFEWPSWIVGPLRAVGYFFPALRYEEGDTITWRKHWVALLGPIWKPMAAIGLVTLVAAWFLTRNGDRLTVLLSYGILLMFLVPWWLWIFEDWQNDIYQVTSSRIIDIEQLPFGLREERREASLGMIQNVSLRVPGLIGRILGYGSVTIETAGAGAFTFDMVKNPERVQSEIFRRMERFAEHERQKRARRRRDELLDWFTVYDQMRHPEARRQGGPILPSSQRGDASDTSSR